MQELCFIAIPRTGTNHLIHVLAGLPLVKSRAEVFHPQAAWGVSQWELVKLNKRAGTNFTAADDPAMVAYVREHPRTLLDVMAEDNGKHHLMCFKIFPGHLSLRSIEQNLILRPSLRFIFVKRRFLDSYISNLKAEKIARFVHAITTDVTITLEFEHFIKMFQVQKRWYHDIAKLLDHHHRAFGSLLYEADIDCPPESMVESVLRAAIRAGIDDPAPLIGKGGKGLAKQDRGGHYAAKVSNWQEFAGQLERAGLLEAALSYL